MEVPLFKEAIAIAVDDGTGVARASAMLGPEKYGDIWHVTLMTSTSNSTTDVQLRVYRNLESAGAMIDSTYAGRQATSVCDYILRGGEKVVVVWSQGDIGATDTIRLEGTISSLRMG
jgi:hypothetical protein